MNKTIPVNQFLFIAGIALASIGTLINFLNLRELESELKQAEKDKLEMSIQINELRSLIPNNQQLNIEL